MPHQSQRHELYFRRHLPQEAATDNTRRLFFPTTARSDRGVCGESLRHDDDRLFSSSPSRVLYDYKLVIGSSSSLTGSSTKNYGGFSYCEPLGFKLACPSP
ncbi:hypothetical protein M6B38_355400 [Iris pallida]|uniref:Uncharacterized protein n=1 Tax=Iris pallida TaxID=29817 RepID=A0AAX6FAD6_IRIPA|nr:hypothetical protein M6B38_143550 [Iris pallida]KAJ6830256.1 hypothetical protein M6B38_355400 [Iris pallida]